MGGGLSFNWRTQANRPTALHQDTQHTYTHKFIYTVACTHIQAAEKSKSLFPVFGYVCASVYVRKFVDEKKKKTNRIIYKKKQHNKIYSSLRRPLLEKVTFSISI